MPSTFKVLSLGQQAMLDTVEGNYTAENAEALVGLSFGKNGEPLHTHKQVLTEIDASGGNAYAYDMNNAHSNDQFSIDGGPPQTFDGTAVYNATLTYTDGTTETFTAVVFQDTEGNTYLAPEFSQNADQATLEAKPLMSLSLDSVAGNRYSGMTTNREDSNFVTCFVGGTRIATPSGERPVDTLNVGDQVVTRDHGTQTIRWIGGRTVRCHGGLVPIRIHAHALGLGLPHQTLFVSKQHRMLISSRISDRMFGAPEVLIPAHKLLGLPGIHLAPEAGFVTFWHLLCDQHEVVFANGAPSETLFLGDMARRGLVETAHDEINALFPDLVAQPQKLARLVPKGHAQNRLVARLIKNGRTPLESRKAS